MPNVDIPHRIDTGDSPRRQETIGGTFAQTMSERVLKQPNEPPLIEGYTSGSGEDRLEENIKLSDTVTTPYDSPLTGGYTPRSNEGRITLAELMETYTTFSNRVTQLENEISTTKAVYHKVFITLTNIVKKLESQLKQKRSSEVIHSSDKEGPSRSLAKDKGKRIMKETELPKKLKKKDMIQLSLDEELAQKLQLDQRKENLPKGDQAKEIDWNDPQVLRYHALQNIPFPKAEVRKNMIMYLRNQGGYKKSYFKGMKYEDIRPLFERIWDQVYTFVPKDSEIEREETEEEVEAQGNSYQEVEELKLYMRIIPEKYIAIKAIPLAIKPLVIIEYKIVKERKINTYHITRVDGSTRRYTSMINLLEYINKEYLETLWKLVKEKYGNTRPEEGYERVLWGDLKVMFKPDIESEVWRQLQGHEVTFWKLFSSCGLHFVRFKNLHIFLLVDKVYPLTPATINMMLERKLQADQWNKMCY
nr:hypothetical protein [Tanacetum cinerariifolium]